MDEATQKALQSEVVYYITAALVTLLAITISFKWVYRTVVRRGSGDTRNCKENVSSGDQASDIITQSSSEDESPQVANDDSHDNKHGNDTIPEEEEEDLEDLGDLGDILINHSEITPLVSSLSEGSRDAMADGEEVSEGDAESKTDYLVGPQKTKKLVEEVSKLMSDEQKEEERRIQASQLEAIFKLMQNQQETFGMNTIKDVQDQFKLYA